MAQRSAYDQNRLCLPSLSHARLEFAGCRVTVMGLGQFGGGVGAVRFLFDRGAHVTVSDRRTAEQLGDVVRQFKTDERLTWHLGAHRDADFIDTDLIVVSPAVTPNSQYVQLAQNQGVRLTSEIGLFWERCQGRIVGVTGTNGKTTTASLLYDCLKNDGRRVWLGGNIGGSLLDDIDNITSDGWVVLELSSFQLHALDAIQVSPHVSVVTNFTANHLDWHPSLDHYRDAKQTILRWQQSDDVAVLGGWDEVRGWPARAKRLIADDAIERPDVPAALRGLHHARNIACVVAAAGAMGISESAIQQAIIQFSGLPHRMQLLGTFEDRNVYNDSAATTPESTIAALTSLDCPKVVLVGGADKGIDLTQLADGLHRHAAAVILMGAVAPRLEQLMQTLSTDSSIGPRDVVTAESIEDAVRKAFSLSSPGDTVLLSPGCSSYGWFTNYVERGNEFIRLVHELSIRSAANCN